MNDGIGDPHVLREYALLADGQRGALIGPRGDISWMCAPRWDSDAVFSALIGGRGVFAITPRGAIRLGRSLRGRQPDLAVALGDHRRASSNAAKRWPTPVTRTGSY